MLSSSSSTGRRLIRLLCLLSVLAALWAAVVIRADGIVVRIGSVRVLSSRIPWPAVVVALICGLAACVLSLQKGPHPLFLTPHVFLRATFNQWRERIVRSFMSFAEELPPQTPTVLAACMALGTVALGVLRGAPYAGGSDAYGYVSQAHLWARGTLHVEQPFVSQVRWPFAAEAFTPLGYRPTADGTAVVPVYSPGLPTLMGLFERFAEREAVFYVVPLLGGVAVWATYLMGRGLGGRGVGLVATVLLATSPTFLFHLMFPTSDVPATAWWALALALSLRDGAGAALGSGVAVAAAILTRPNLVPLAAIPGALLMWRTARGQRATRQAAQRAIWFGGPVLAACVIVGIINDRLWGSPFASGYGSFEMLYAWKNLVPNLQRYPKWLLDTQTPLILLALLAPIVSTSPERARSEVRAIAVMWSCFVAGVFLSYLFHLPNETWFWLRYLLPAFPPLFVLTSVVLVTLLIQLKPSIRLTVITTIVGLVASYGVAFGWHDGIFDFRQGERKSRAIGEYIANHFPERAISLSQLHSGSVRYYSGRLTIRYEWIPPGALDSVIADLRRLQYEPYILLEAGEESLFRQRFGSRSTGALDWPPKIILNHRMQVRLYDPTDREAFLMGQRISSDVIR